MTIITDVPSEGPVEMKGPSGKTLIRPPWMAWLKQIYLICFAVQQSGTTAQRPTTYLWVGRTYFDTTLTRPIWYTGANWIKADGTVV